MDAQTRGAVARKEYKTMITQGELRNQIEYDPETGLWRWRDATARVNRKVGWFAGAPIANGYMTIRIDGTTYYAHRLAWLYMMGSFVEDIDHVNRVKYDNRFFNLRLGNKSVNVINSKTRIDSSTGQAGVSLHSNGRWHGYINKDGKRYSKFFGTKEEAIAWRLKKQEELFGEFGKIVSLDRKQGC
jgi:hypothetical protein